MSRLLLLLMLALVVWSYFPETRAILIDVGAPVVVPVLSWSAQEEMEQIGRNVVEHERLTGSLATGPDWLPWLDFRYVGEDVGRDPWSSTYQLEVRGDSVAIVSLGPDRVRGTEDDFEVLTARGR